MKLNLWPVKGVNVYDLPTNMRAMFPYASANEEDCIPQHEQAKPDSHRELEVEVEGESTTFVPFVPTFVVAPLVVNTSKVINLFNR